MALPIQEMKASDEEFLDKIEYDSILYFAEEANPRNGLIKDSSRPGAPCSVAAVGFGLAAMCIGNSRGWIDYDKAYERVLKTLKTFRDNVPNEHGFFYHFLDMRTGSRTWSSELSSIDTALFLAGALFAGEYFKGTEIDSIAQELYRRVEWPWMMNGRPVMCMGWKPESGFLWYYWDSYNEAIILYALAIGSPTYPISKEAWLAWKRPVGTYKDYKLVYCSTGSLFTYQYSHVWIDFRNIYDGDINYFENSVNATKANRQFCIDESSVYSTYGENSWGLTACIGPDGYKSYGAKPGEALNDGTIAPCGMASSFVFDWQESLKGLKYLYENYGSFLYGRYGFKDAFNLDRKWWADEHLGISLGASLLMIENYRSGLIWEKFMGIEFVNRWIDLCMTREKPAIQKQP
ncbi:MAG: hypothetical protein JXB40_02620 [Candidatus Omnitrophica bacterium]|nr:hypothetical protein [Candidatus Omnitrophota bacterium]